MQMYQRIRDLREDEQLSQKQIAEKLFDTQQHYQLYESGKREPPFSFAIQLSKIYNVSLDYIAGLTNSKGGMHKNTAEEQDILSKYNALSDKSKGRILQLLEMLYEEEKQGD
jgi:transcriptional regulator with XRE-family HTH domain